MTEVVALNGRRPVAEYRIAAALFLRVLGIIYAVAFLSMWTQLEGLAGSQGIFPLAEQLEAATGEHGGLVRYWYYPSLFWLWSSDAALFWLPLTGAAAASLLAFGRQQRFALWFCFLAYLSCYHAGRIFTEYQWDYLLLESGFLALLLRQGGGIAVWLFKWLLFKLRFLSGLSKLLSGDPAWSGLTALTTYFETQPLPHAGAWYAHQLPEGLLRFGAGATLFIELVVPFFIFLPRPWRLFAAATTVLWQLLIIATSNHNFFNLLTIALCLFLLDDQLLRRWLPAAPQLPVTKRFGVPAVMAAVVVVPVAAATSWEMIRGQPLPAWIGDPVNALDPLRIANRYHVFPTMPKERIELEIEGSLDGTTWQTYEFRFKPGEPTEPPAFCIPHQPRIDWLMWFVPAGGPFFEWFDRFLQRLMEASPPVLALLREDPFMGARPQVLRVQVWRYRFSDPETRARTGEWWARESLGPFWPFAWREQTR